MVSGEYFRCFESRDARPRARPASLGAAAARGVRRAAVCGGERREAGVSLTGAHGGHGPGVHGHG